MTLTRDFHETVVARAKRDPTFKPALLMEALQSFLEGEVAPGLIILRDCINATVGFSALAKQTQIPEKSLMRMVGPHGNPTASNLFAIMAALQQANDTRVPRAKARRLARLDTPQSKLPASKRKVEPNPEEKREVSWKKVYAAANRAAAKKAEAAKPPAPAKKRVHDKTRRNLKPGGKLWQTKDRNWLRRKSRPCCAPRCRSCPVCAALNP